MTKSQLYTFLLTYQESNHVSRSWVDKALTDFPNVLKTLKINLGDELGTQEVYEFLKPGEGRCVVCGKQTKFQTFTKGFKSYCSVQCSNEARYGASDEIESVAEPKLVVSDFDDIVDPANPPKAKEDKPAKKRVISEVEKPLVITKDPVLKTPGGTMHGKAEKPTIAAEYNQPRVRLLADLKQFGIRESRPKEKWDFTFKPIIAPKAKSNVEEWDDEHPPRITQGHWDQLKEAQELVERSESDRLARKARREQRKNNNDKQEVHSGRVFELQGMEPQALSTLLYEMQVPLHMFDEQPKEVGYTDTATGTPSFYKPNLVLQNKVVIHVEGVSIAHPDKLQLVKDKCTGTTWTGRHFLLLIVDTYGNILDAKVDQVTEFEMVPLDHENVQELAKIIKGLLLD
jgi:hypothetical protein